MNYMKHPQNELGLWEIAVLALLREAPMHPYQMRRLLTARHKDEILALRHGSLYHAIRRLEAARQIAIESTGREGRRPERTTYRMTPEGAEAFAAALRKMVSAPKHESSEFMAAMSFLVHLPPEEAAARLRERAAALEASIAAREAALAGAAARVTRIHLIESEYLLVMLRAELQWVRTLLEEMNAGRLSWNLEEILRSAEPERAKAHGKQGKKER